MLLLLLGLVEKLMVVLLLLTLTILSLSVCAITPIAHARVWRLASSMHTSALRSTLLMPVGDKLLVLHALYLLLSQHLLLLVLLLSIVSLI